MSKTTKVILFALVVYLANKKNPAVGTTLGDASQDYFIASTVLTVF